MIFLFLFLFLQFQFILILYHFNYKFLKNLLNHQFKLLQSILFLNQLQLLNLILLLTFYSFIFIFNCLFTSQIQILYFLNLKSNIYLLPGYFIPFLLSIFNFAFNYLFIFFLIFLFSKVKHSIINISLEYQQAFPKIIAFLFSQKLNFQQISIELLVSIVNKQIFLIQLKFPLLIKELNLVFKIKISKNHFRRNPIAQMVKFTVEQVRQIMNHQENIRNMSVIAHVDHGKSTLSDALICKAGIISEQQAGKARALDNRKDQIQRGITIKSTGVSLYYEYDITYSNDPANKQKYLFNLIDSPGHVDFSSQVTAALRVTDGALVVVDTIQGVCVQTQTVLRQAMQEKIRPVLMINKVDRAILELKLEGEEMYQQFVKVIDNVNVVIGTYQSQDMGSLVCDPTIGNVAFGAGKDQWAFTLRTFARMYSKMLNINEENLMQKLWGDYYFDPQSKKIVTQAQNKEGKTLQRTFVKFVIDPIIKMCTAIMKNDKETYEELIKKTEVQINAQEKKKLVEKDLLKTVMSRWLSAADCLMEMMIMHLPSPKEAQKYRAEYLYQGPTDDEVCNSMKNCDPKGPLVVYISKMIPLDNTRFAAFGRIFSGTVSSGQKIKIMGANYKNGHHHDLFEKSISQVGVYMMGKIPEYMSDVPCGNTVAIVGIDDHLMKTGTLGSPEIKDLYPIKSMKYSVSPVYKVAVRCKNPADLPKFEKGLKRLSKSDPLIKVQKEQTGQITIAGSGQLHIEICLNDLRQLSQCEIIVSEPSVTYQETITIQSNEKLLTKSANKHNRFFGTTEILSEQLIQMIEGGDIVQKMDAKERTKILVEQFQWDKNDTFKIWCFGPENTGPNILVDQVKQAQYMNQVKDSVSSAFQTATRHGVLAEENLRGVRFNIVDSVLHTDSVHRNGPQITPCARRLFNGLELASKPTLLEPIFLVEITAPASVLGGVYQTINQRRGQIIDEIKQQGSPLHVVKAYLPVSESFGLSSILRGNTQGRAFPQCFFDHWQKIGGMPYVDPKADQIVREIRKRKGLKLDLPIIEDYLDKL